ncbi:hypothetical protein EYZ11_004979 [Aspergillus tanneri]|uniref:Uncharacterized protein n=1 Tax=Aspergillus tanneri TaxID=1220188 RepID=A0A4V3UPK6_9EURO|nr:hypothetical protein EYZ11_004979 [Aspergillus tanneri]
MGQWCEVAFGPPGKEALCSYPNNGTHTYVD